MLFTGEARAALDGRNGRAKVWTPNGTPTPCRFHRQQEGGGIMF